MIYKKYFHFLANRYLLLVPYLRCRRNVSRLRYITREKQKSYFTLPIETSALNLSRVDKSISLSFYSQASNIKQDVKECPAGAATLQPVKFEEMCFALPVTHAELLEELNKCKSLSEQMERLASTLALPQDDIEKRVKFCKSLEALFSPFFHNFKIQMFGSTVNSFGFKGCDIDMTFETTAVCKDRTYLERPDIPLVSEVVNGKVSPQEVSELPYKEQLLFMHTILLEYYSESEASAIFINAHVPLVRFYHDKYGLKCDLTFKNRVAYANTKLLYLYAKLDPRIIPLMMTLRYWAKHIELIGKGLMFNTYTISLMVIYFLQNTNPPILPSAEYILSLSSGFEIDDMIDKSFLNILADIPPTKNNQTLDELLRGFFFFYLYFDFTRVICPLTAKAIPRDEFFSLEENRKFKMNTICVQDPLELSHNVAEFADYKTCKKFYTELAMTCKMFQDGEISSIFTKGNQGLVTILDKPQNYSLKSANNYKSFSLTVPLKSQPGEKESSQIERAFDTASTVMKILEHSLLFEYKLLEVEKVHALLRRQDILFALQKKQMEEQSFYKKELDRMRKKAAKKDYLAEDDTCIKEPEAPMLEQFKTLSSKNKLVLCAQCKVSSNTWLGRDLVKIDSPIDLEFNLLKRERLVSELTAKQNRHNALDKKTKDLLFLCECFISDENSEQCLLVNFRPLQTMSFNAILGVFLKDYIPKILKNLNPES